MGHKSSIGIQLSRFVHDFIAFLRFGLLRLQEGGAGGWGVCRVIRVSLDEFRNVQR